MAKSEKETPTAKGKEGEGKKKSSSFKDLLVTLLIAAVIAFALKYFVITSCKVLSSSMLPTLSIDDRVLAFRLSYNLGEPQRGDIIIFEPPAEHDEGVDYIKRIIGLPGETLEVKEGKVFIDGVALEESYIAEAPNYEFAAVTVPEDEYFVMGDNRNHSLDSHLWTYHFVKADDIDGKIIFQYYPFTELGTFKDGSNVN